MFQNIKIESSTDKTTSTNKPYKACEVLDESGASFKVNVWSDFPDFANIKAGSVVRAKLEQKGQYWNIVSETQAKPKGGNPAYKQKIIEETMERKEKSISNFQSNKEESIKISSTMNKAVDLAIAEYNLDKTNFDNLDVLITKWREWLWTHWDVQPTQYPPF